MTNAWIIDGQKTDSASGGGSELLVELKLQSNGGSPFLFGTHHHNKIGCGQFTPTEVSDPENCWTSDAFNAPSDGVYEFVVEGADLKQLVTTVMVSNDPFGFGVLINDTFIYYSTTPGPGVSGDGRSSQFRIQLELTAGDTCKLISLTNWIPFHNLHPSYTDVHAGPANSKIRIYKCALS
ncbi:hypothetical protein [Tichowtungia aerotolerans]|uniref:Uncharacterized protein n=1 Tax=Tichowtungia aerotolerans TaxID=2697043 RepID=A0A6P1M636_9BACT|nr:hypothetical protein [Tichowtungia aerotolerans]QHI68463.1 hypothetical protein GT409_03010 [Tichowtungia aerotolerans]